MHQSEYDSRADTEADIARVRELLNVLAAAIAARGDTHDASKLAEPEKSAFDRATPKLKSLTYGSPEYQASLAELDEALAHHYAHNSHHPAHFADGIAGMTLIDLIEYFADCKAASERHKDGDYALSLKVNKERFAINDQLHSILVNTARQLGWIKS